MKTAGTIRTVLTALATLLLTLTPSIAQETRPVDVVVMLDTSGSMEDLLEAALDAFRPKGGSCRQPE